MAGGYEQLELEFEPMKYCRSCERGLPRTAFSRDRSKRDGLRSRCKTCDAETSSAWYAANADAVRERHARWYARMRP